MDAADPMEHRGTPEDLALEPSDHDRIVAIDLRTGETQRLVEAVVHLLMPKDGAKEGPTLEQLILAVLSQLRDATSLLRDIQRTLDGMAGGAGEAVGTRDAAPAASAGTAPAC